MKILTIIQDKEIPSSPKPKMREASRGVFFDDEDLIPILYVSKHGYHKLPGGGIEGEEDQSQALIREILEETGCNIEIIGEVGIVNEYRSQENLLQTSYCYFGKITTKGIPHFTQKEIRNGFQIKWMKLDDAIKTIDNDLPKKYEGTFIQKRDLKILNTVKVILRDKK